MKILYKLIALDSLRKRSRIANILYYFVLVQFIIFLICVGIVAFMVIESTVNGDSDFNPLSHRRCYAGMNGDLAWNVNQRIAKLSNGHSPSTR